MACFAMEFPDNYLDISIEISKNLPGYFKAKHDNFPGFYLVPLSPLPIFESGDKGIFVISVMSF